MRIDERVENQMYGRDDCMRLKNGDYYVIPPGPMKWEYLLFGYVLYAAVLVWYVTEKLLVWDPNAAIAGLPKPIFGSLLICLHWGIMNFVLFAVYNVALKKREQALLGKGGEET